MKLLKFILLLLVRDVAACVCMLKLLLFAPLIINGANRSNFSIQTHAATSRTRNSKINFSNFIYEIFFLKHSLMMVTETCRSE